MKKRIINENQKGFLFKNGRYIKLLDAGKYHLFGGKEIEISNLDQPITCSKCALETLLADKAVAERLTMAEYEAQMAGVYSTCVVPDTLDESPMAYKSMDEIVENIGPTAEILCRIKPIYNFKAAE